jgi:hypothetical protein
MLLGAVLHPGVVFLLELHALLPCLELTHPLQAFVAFLHLSFGLRRWRCLRQRETHRQPERSSGVACVKACSGAS